MARAPPLPPLRHPSREGAPPPGPRALDALSQCIAPWRGAWLRGLPASPAPTSSVRRCGVGDLLLERGELLGERGVLLLEELQRVALVDAQRVRARRAAEDEHVAVLERDARRRRQPLLVERRARLVRCVCRVWRVRCVSRVWRVCWASASRPWLEAALAGGGCPWLGLGSMATCSRACGERHPEPTGATPAGGEPWPPSQAVASLPRERHAHTCHPKKAAMHVLHGPWRRGRRRAGRAPCRAAAPRAAG